MKQSVLDSLPDSEIYERDPEELTDEEAEEWLKRVTKAREKLQRINEALTRSKHPKEEKS